MYKIYINGTVVHDTTINDCYTIEPQIEYSNDNIGTLSFTAPAINKALKAGLKPKQEDLVLVTKSGKIPGEEIKLYYGLITSAKKTFHNSYVVDVSSPALLLRQTIIEPVRLEKNLKDFLAWLFDKHNQLRGRQELKIAPTVSNFLSGDTSVWDITEYTSSYDLYIDAIKKVKERTGQRIVFTYSGSANEYTHTLNIWEKETVNQNIEYGVNLMDITQYSDFSELKTVLLPLGATDSNGERLVLQPDPRVINADAVARYGIREMVKIYDAIDDPKELRAKALEDLCLISDPITSLELRAVDLNLIDPSLSSFEIGDEVRVISEPHGINKKMPVVSKVLDLERPENSEVVLGIERKRITDI